MNGKEVLRRPGSLAETMRNVKEGRQDFSTALSEFLDEFYLREQYRQAAIAEKPVLVGNSHQDAFIGAVGEHLARRWGLQIPEWTHEPARFLKEPMFSSPAESMKALLLVESPVAFRRRMIFVEAEPLRRARMPQTPAPRRKFQESIRA